METIKGYGPERRALCPTVHFGQLLHIHCTLANNGITLWVDTYCHDQVCEWKGQILSIGTFQDTTTIDCFYRHHDSPNQFAEGSFGCRTSRFYLGIIEQSIPACCLHLYFDHKFLHWLWHVY